MLKIVPGAVFNKRNPIVIGVDVVEGQLRLGTPLAAITADRGVVPLGKVTSIELNHKAREVVKKGEPAVAIKIECPQYETPKFIGRHFMEKDNIVSHITRNSIDVLKSTFRDDVSKEEWATVVKVSCADVGETTNGADS
jgi:translation initiation factor 5B